MRAGTRVAWVVAGLVACGGGKRERAPDAGVVAAAGDAGVPRLGDEAIAARFTELRDAPSLRCLLDAEGYGVLDALAVDSPPAVARIAAFASFEPRRKDGDSPMLLAMVPAVGFLGTIGDDDGLKQLFAEVDRIGLPVQWGSALAYRARVGLPLPDDLGEARMGVIRELALAGDVDGARRLYDQSHGVLTARPDHVGAMVALGEVDAARLLIDTEAAQGRAELAVAWLQVAIQKKSGVADAVTYLLGALPAADPPQGLMYAIRDARRAGLAAEVAPLRRALIERLARNGVDSYPRLLPELLEEAVAIGDLGERSRLAAMAPDPVKRWVFAMREGTLAQSLEMARSRRDLARVWARHVVEGADPAFEKKLADLACAGRVAAASGEPPAPPENLTLEVAEENTSTQSGCTRYDLALRLKNAGGGEVDSRVLFGQCTGACTAADRKYAEELKKELEKRIAEGWATQADLERIVTTCTFSGYRPGKTDSVGGRGVALFVEEYDGRQRYLLAYEACGRIAFSQPFAEATVPWRLDQLTVKLSDDGRELQVDAASDSWRGVAYRVVLPPAGCATAPVEHVTRFP